MAVFLIVCARFNRVYPKRGVDLKRSNRSIKMKKRQKKNKERLFYYGMALLTAVFVVVGLTTAIKGAAEESVEVSRAEKVKPEDEEKADKVKEDNDKTDEEKNKETDQNEKITADNPDIRVLIMTNGFSDITHSQVSLSSESGMVVTYGENKKEYKGENTLKIAPDHKWFDEGTVRVGAKKGKIKIESIKRGDGQPSYDGVIELRSTAEGIVIINELPVESYLCGVVPSEMPASYELEALKAQAVCARSYAYRQMEKYAYPEYEAHINDSSSYQVYNNSKQAKASSKAVKETAGQTVRYKGEIVSTYFYSTSCGKTTTMEAWGTKPGKKNGYLYSAEVKGENGDYEKELPWYRWSVTAPAETLSNLVGLNTGKDIGRLESIEITKRGPGDVAIVMKVVGDKGSVTVKTENKIRRALGGSEYKIRRQDGSETNGRDLLPSAFFTIEKKGDEFVIQGGGFGHGIGMSQTGANEMAKQGKNYKEILALFYKDIMVE